MVEQQTRLRYTIQLNDPSRHAIQVLLELPTNHQPTIDLAMAVWSPGFYRLEAYAERLSDLQASDEAGNLLPLEQIDQQRWRVQTGTAEQVSVRYQLACSDSSVTTNWVSTAYGLWCGPATFLGVVGQQQQPCDLILDLPEGWQAFLALPSSAGIYHAADFDTLLDSPILAAAQFDLQRFEVDGIEHILVAVGHLANWNGARAAADLARFAAANQRLWQVLPFERYLFLVVCREGGGGLEHADSTIVTANPNRLATEAGYAAWIRLASHEYFHAWNVKRLRPAELGPFDYQIPARTAGLWVAEGLTCYYTDLLLCRAGIWQPTQFLAALSGIIAQLQQSPGRLVQNLEQSSLTVWENSFSGLHTSDESVSYYIKGHVVGFLLDAHLRRMSAGVYTLDELMRRAYLHFGGSHGFGPGEIEALVAELGGAALATWLQEAVASTNELEYQQALAWYGLSFTGSANTDPANQWEIQISDPHDPTTAERRNAWLQG